MKEKDFVDILWKYFELHSNQRMQMINFSLVVHSLLITILVELFVKDSTTDLTPYKILVCIAILVFSFVFYMLDRRTKELIKNCETSLKAIEQKYVTSIDNNVMIFSIEEQKSRNNFTFSYTKSITISYLFFALIAIICLILIA